MRESEHSFVRRGFRRWGSVVALLVAFGWIVQGAMAMNDPAYCGTSAWITSSVVGGQTRYVSNTICGGFCMTAGGQGKCIHMPAFPGGYDIWQQDVATGKWSKIGGQITQGPGQPHLIVTCMCVRVTVDEYGLEIVIIASSPCCNLGGISGGAYLKPSVAVYGHCDDPQCEIQDDMTCEVQEADGDPEIVEPVCVGAG